MTRSGLRPETLNKTSQTQSWHQNEKDPLPSPKSYHPYPTELKLPTSWKIHPVFHASLLTPYHKNEIHGLNFPAPPPDLIDNEEEYEIEWN